MTPTLSGRWQTRLLLTVMLGVPVSLFFGFHYADRQGSFFLLGYLLLIGLAWDLFYQFLQSLRWDEDWPTFLQLMAGLIEGAFLWGLISVIRWQEFGLLGMPGIGVISFQRFCSHYVAVWLAIFLILQGPIHVLFPRWRFYGGRWF